jgi:hypothetical protein
MALYEYRCADCEERFDLMRPMSAADDVAECDLQLRLHHPRGLLPRDQPHDGRAYGERRRWRLLRRGLRLRLTGGWPERTRRANPKGWISP